MGAVPGAASLQHSLSPRQLLTKLMSASDHFTANQRGFFCSPEKCKVQQRDAFCRLKTVPPFLPVAPTGSLLRSVGCWSGLRVTRVSWGLQHCSSSLGAFPMDSFNHYFTLFLSRVRSLEEEGQYSTEVLPFRGFSSEKKFPWIVSSS